MIPTPAALLPPEDAERLRTLRHYDIVHTLHESVFDEFVALTARIFSLPISLIALVDENEVYYHASYGLPGLLSQPRVEAICSLVVRENKAVVLTDLTNDDALRLTAAADAAARDKGLRFYAGAPLRMPDQRNIGTLCVIDRTPRTFSADEQQILDQVAQLVGQTIAVRHYCLTGKGLGEPRWQAVRSQVVEELVALGALVRYLLARYSAQIPVPDAVLEPVARRLNDLRRVLAEYQQ
ncbi:GAF domain-containing protein [Hymenobacter nivis]|uniref:GAF domain-containing protein n=1 Tax=Hymenobacter nivis TaxID=1850093 RepID=A0A502HB93_9BACT|nr:GAF domain-containing protein [Hymenobacter nivis]TPG72019.1 GAF domain-containing protein [Hymenobacter nivis]